MNYRHAFHAGNFADVVKHVALAAILLHLKKKETPFAVIDTHAGRGLYDLKSGEAARTNESDSGIGRLKDLADGPPSLLAYLGLVRGLGEALYPGSPLIAARMKRPIDRLVAVEKHDEEYAALARALSPFVKTRALHADGYEQLAPLLPPAERRGVVVIDPPYEAPSEFGDAARALVAAHRRFATGIYLAWFPEKSERDADALCGEVLAAGLTRALRIDFDIGKASDDRMQAAGLLIVNPPYGFEEEMTAVLQVLEQQLGESSRTPARGRISSLEKQ